MTTATELFRTADVLVRRAIARAGARSRICFVTFASYTNEYTLDRQGFGEDFLRAERIDAIHVISHDNRWYRYPEMPAALAAICAGSAGYERVVTYGSSMGGYAALRFASAVGAGTAIAISPQYSIDPAAAPFENRWQADAARITVPEPAFEPAPEQIIFYDPRLRPDALHYEAFAALAPTRGVGLPFAGHPVGPILVETGVLKDTIRSIVAGTFDPAGVQRATRARRRASQHHYFSLSRRVADTRPELAIALLRRAAEIEPESHIASELAALLDRRGDHAEAAPLHALALERVPGNVRARINWARHLEATGRPLDAAAELRAAAAVQRGSTRILVRTVQLRMALRRWRLGPLDRLVGRIIERTRFSESYGSVMRFLGRVQG